MCDCYKIGGPFIAEDPSCPVHGYDAQRENEDRERQRQSMQDQIDDLSYRLSRLEETVSLKG